MTAPDGLLPWWPPLIMASLMASLVIASPDGLVMASLVIASLDGLVSNGLAPDCLP